MQKHKIKEHERNGIAVR